MPCRRYSNDNPNVQSVSQALKECHISESHPQPDIVMADAIPPELLSKWPKKKNIPPAVFLHRPVNILQVKSLCEELGRVDCYLKISANFVKFNGKSFDIYNAIVRYLINEKLAFHTFGHPDTRMIKVVVRDLPLDIDLNTVKEHLQNAGIPVVRIHKMHRSESDNHKTPLILVILPNNRVGRKMLRVTHILGHSVKLEPSHPKTRQCHHCQKWGHSQRYCHGYVKCVKCAGGHLSSTCRKQPEEPAKCANCGDAHTANYKKCSSCPESTEYKKKNRTRK